MNLSIASADELMIRLYNDLSIAAKGDKLFAEGTIDRITGKTEASVMRKLADNIVTTGFLRLTSSACRRGPCYR
jgi:hypothetical protein